MLGNLSLDQLRVLVTIVDAGSFSAAGRKLGRAQSAISQAIATLGLFVGTLLSALLYNLVIHTGQRYAFQRWYLLWVGAASTSTASDWRRC